MASQPSLGRERRMAGRPSPVGSVNGGVQADLSAVAPRDRAGAEADVAQLAERVLGKDEVTSSILVIGSRVLTT